MNAIRRRGFTLVELLIAILVLAAGVIAGSAAILSTNSAQRRTSRRGEMAVVAESKLEEIRTRVAAGDAALISTLKPPPVGSLTASLASYHEIVTYPNNVQYLLRWQIEQAPALTEKVTMRVIWPATGTPELQVDLVTYVLVP